MLKKISIYGFICLLLLILSACINFQKMTNNNIVGVWIEDKKTCQNNCSVIEFYSDGHFKGINFPSEYFGYVQSFTDRSRFDASGTWTLINPKDPLGYYEVDFDFPYPSTTPGILSGYHSTVYIDQSEKKQMFCSLEDNGNNVTYTKQK